MDGQGLIEDGRITTFGRLVECHALLWHRLDRELQEAVGLSLLWYGVLLHLGRSPGAVRPMGELAEATAFTSGGVTRLVDRMEQARLVERRPCPSDRRVHYVGLTERGREILERATQVHLRGIQEHLVDALSPHEVALLDAILARLLTSTLRDPVTHRPTSDT
jgi:DNA-binding MarR family transcriptional regulator